MNTRDSKRTTRDKAAAAKAAADADQRRRDNRIRLIGGLAVLVVVGAIFGGVYVSRSNTSAANAPDANAALPVGVDKDTFGVPYGSAGADKPQLQLWEDFQCPGCARLEKDNGTGITALADTGAMRLLWRPTTFLDAKLNNDASLRATAAWGCAIDAGKAKQYHSLVFANQPAQEGAGYTDALLLDLGKQAGISGAALTTFNSCVAARTYNKWTQNSYEMFNSEAVPGTPAGYLIYKDQKQELKSEVLSDPVKLAQAVKDIQTS